MDDVFSGPKIKSMEREVAATDTERLTKRIRVISMEGREVMGPGYSSPTRMPDQRWLRRVTTPHGSHPNNRAINRERSGPEDCDMAREGETANDEPHREIINLAQPGEANPA
jgi:hypothetical protein